MFEKMSYKVALGNKIGKLKLLGAVSVIVCTCTPLRSATVKLEWDPSPSPEVEGYTLYYGQARNVYAENVKVGKQTTASLDGLADGKRYFFNVTARTQSGIESDFAGEITSVMPANINLPFWYDFRVPGVLHEAPSSYQGASAYWWLASGAYLTLEGGLGKSVQGTLPHGDPWRELYSQKRASTADGGLRPQNIFQLFLRKKLKNVSEEIYVLKKSDNLSSSGNINSWNGFSLYMRYRDEENHYFAGIRADGYAVIKKKKDGIYQTLAYTRVFPGTWNAVTHQNLIPANTWIGLKAIINDSGSTPYISFYMDVGRTGNWTLVAQATDSISLYGPPVEEPGFTGMRSDCMDIEMDDFRISDPSVLNSFAMNSPGYLFTSPDLPKAVIRGFSTDGSPYISVIGDPGLLFVLQKSTDLVSWEDILESTTDGTDEPVYSDSGNPSGHCFYRAVSK